MDTRILELRRLEQTLIEAALRGGHIREGTVMTLGAPPYRRLDCDGRALAYVRARPSKRAVRVDVSGLWVPAPRTTLLHVSSRSGLPTLLVRDGEDAEEAARFLEQTVESTRGALDRRLRAQKPWPRKSRMDP